MNCRKYALNTLRCTLQILRVAGAGHAATEEEAAAKHAALDQCGSRSAQHHLRNMIEATNMIEAVTRLVGHNFNALAKTIELRSRKFNAGKQRLVPRNS